MDSIGVSVIGAGGFAHFAIQQFSQVPGFRFAGVYDASRPAAERMTARFGGIVADSQDALIAHPDTDLVYLGTPPHLHHPQSMAALEASKHVIVEKPFAMTVEQAREMIAAAERRGLLVVANLMQRYNPVYEAMRRLIVERRLGELLHATFENYATDESLPPEHWFWDREKSGGIFIEHGVHFFDMFEGWLGEGRVVAAQRTLRPGTDIEEQVQCTVRYRDGIHVNFYHGFVQPQRMDRQEMTFLFERGDVKLYEWVPVRARIHALVGEADLREIGDLFPQSRTDVTVTYSGADRICHGRHKEYDVSQMVDIYHGEGVEKWHRYGELLRGLFADQTTWIRDRSHPRKLTEVSGLNSTAMAVEATRLATT